MDEKVRKALNAATPWTASNSEADDDEDNRCDLDPTKICDNCMLCVTGGADYRAITISGIELENEYRAKHPEQGERR